MVKRRDGGVAQKSSKGRKKERRRRRREELVFMAARIARSRKRRSGTEYAVYCLLGCGGVGRIKEGSRVRQ